MTTAAMSPSPLATADVSRYTPSPSVPGAADPGASAAQIPAALGPILDAVLAELASTKGRADASATDERPSAAPGATTRDDASVSAGAGPDAAAPTGAPESAAVPTEVAALLRGLGDADSLLAALETSLRDAQTNMGEARAGAARGKAEVEHKAQADSIERANAAARKARRFLKWAPKWVKKLVTAVLAAVSAVASAFTGGASIALFVGLVLVLGAEYLTKGLVAAGIVPKDKAQWVTMGLKLVGAALMMGGGIANVAEASAGGIAATLTTVATVTSEAFDLFDSGMSIAGNVQLGNEAEHQADAGRHAASATGALSEMSDAADWIREVYERFRRVAGRLEQAQEASAAARLAGARGRA